MATLYVDGQFDRSVREDGKVVTTFRYVEEDRGVDELTLWRRSWNHSDMRITTTPVAVPVTMTMTVTMAVSGLLVLVCLRWFRAAELDLGVFQVSRRGDDDRANAVADVEQHRGALPRVRVLLGVGERPTHDTAGTPGLDEYPPAGVPRYGNAFR